MNNHTPYIQLVPHQERPTSDLDGESTLKPFSRGDWWITFALCMVCVAPIVLAAMRPVDPVLAQLERDLRQVERDRAELQRIYLQERSKVMALRAQVGK